MRNEIKIVFLAILGLILLTTGCVEMSSNEATTIDMLDTKVTGACTLIVGVLLLSTALIIYTIDEKTRN